MRAINVTTERERIKALERQVSGLQCRVWNLWFALSNVAGESVQVLHGGAPIIRVEMKPEIYYEARDVLHGYKKLVHGVDGAGLPIMQRSEAE